MHTPIVTLHLRLSTLIQRHSMNQHHGTVKTRVLSPCPFEDIQRRPNRPAWALLLLSGDQMHRPVEQREERKRQVSKSVRVFWPRNKDMRSSASWTASARPRLVVLLPLCCAGWRSGDELLESYPFNQLLWRLGVRPPATLPPTSGPRKSCSASAFFSSWPHTFPAPCSEKENINRVSDIKHRCAASAVSLLAPAADSD